MFRRPPRAARIAVEAVKGGIVCLLAMMACGLGSAVTTFDATAAPDAATTQVSAQQQTVDRLMVRHQCSTTGFGPDVVPGSALVLRDEHVRRVSFDAGWRIYTGDAPGILLAVCRATI